MSTQNKAIARQVFIDIQTKRDYDLVDKLVVSDYIGHTPLGDIQGPAGAKEFDTMLHQGFPDFKVTVDEQVAEGDKVATRWTARGTHHGEFQGIPATGKPMTMTGVTIFRIANGKLVEGWTFPNVLGVMQQIGAIPEPSQAS